MRRAKDEGLRVTAEVCPHHLVLTDHWVMGPPTVIPAKAGTHGLQSSVGERIPSGSSSINHYDTHTKVYPPPRGTHDAEALLEGLVDGTIDCIATDHTPHDFAAKMCTYDDAEFGISVLETALGSLMNLVHTGAVDLPLLVDRLTLGPARVLGQGLEYYATLTPGTPPTSSSSTQTSNGSSTPTSSPPRARTPPSKGRRYAVR